MGRGDIEDISNQIKMIYREYGGDVRIEGEDEFEDIPGGGDSSDMTLQDLLTIVDEITVSMAEVTKGFINDFVAQNGVPSAPGEIMKFNSGLMSKGQEAETATLQAKGISSMQFQAVVMKNQESPELQQRFLIMQSITHKLMEEAGIDTSKFGAG